MVSWVKLQEMSERTFVLPGNHETYTFAMEFEYDSWNRIKQMIYLPRWGGGDDCRLRISDCRFLM